MFLCVSCFVDLEGFYSYGINFNQYFCGYCYQIYNKHIEYFNQEYGVGNFDMGINLRFSIKKPTRSKNTNIKNTYIYVLLNILSFNFKTCIPKKNIKYLYENHAIVKKNMKGSHIFNDINEAKIFMRRINFCLLLKSIKNENYEKMKALFILDKFIISFL